MFSNHPPALPLMCKEAMIELYAECEKFTAESDITKFANKLKRFKMTREQKHILSSLLLARYLAIFNPPAENKIFPELRMRRYDANAFYERRPREQHHRDFLGIKWVYLAAGMGNITAVGISDRAQHNAFYEELYDFERLSRNVEIKHGDIADNMIGESYMSQEQLIKVLAYIRNINRNSDITNLLDDLLDLRISRAQRAEIGEALIIRFVQLERGFDESGLDSLINVNLASVMEDVFLSSFLAVTAAFGHSMAIKMANIIDLKYEMNVFFQFNEQERSRCSIL